MPYTLQHCAEAIDYKLNLIDKNKNLLPYPYQTAFPTWLEDMGDGTLLTLTSSATVSEKKIFLNTCILSAGKYIVSVDTTDIVDIRKSVPNPGFSLELSLAGSAITIAEGGNFELSAETTFEVYLLVPSHFDVDLVIKPQIEVAQILEGGTLQNAPSEWVPYMHTVGSYVDERFNSTNTKLRQVLAFMKLVEVVDDDE